MLCFYRRNNRIITVRSYISKLRWRNKMSKYGKMMLVLVTTIFFAVPAFAQDVQSKIEWKMTNWDNPTFPKSYSFNGCNVSVRADGLGVTLNAFDSNWYGKHLTQTVIIEQNKWGGASVKKYCRIAYQTDDGFRLSLETKGYAVFYVKCLDAARHLPQDVRQAFLVHYGL